MNTEPLEEKAVEAAQAADQLAYIKKRVKEIHPIKKFKPWMFEYIRTQVYHPSEKTGTILVRVGMSYAGIYNAKTPEIDQLIIDLKEEENNRYSQKFYDLIHDAFNVYVDLLVNADTDATRLKAADRILTKFKIFENAAKVEVSGSLDLPVINIINEKPVDETS